MRRAVVGVLVLLFASFVAWAAPSTTTVAFRVVTPSGTNVTAGTITAELSQPGTVADGATAVAVGLKSTSAITGTGFTLALVPNANITPAGTYYKVTVQTTAPTWGSWSEKWQIPSSGTPIDSASVVRLQVAPGITTGPFVKWTISTPVGSCSAADPAYYGVDTGANCRCVAGSWNCSTGGPGGDLSDGDKGDVTVSQGGATWVIDPGSVNSTKVDATVAKTADLAAKANLNGPIFGGIVTIQSPFMIGVTQVNASGAELNYSDGVTSNIQDQLDAKQAASALLTAFLALDCGTTGLVNGWNDSTNRWECQVDDQGGGGVSDGDKGDIVITGGGTVWTIKAGSVSSTTVDATIAKTTDLGAKANLDSPTFLGLPIFPPSPAFKIGSATVNATGTEMNYLVGVTSAIQTQIGNKQDIVQFLTDFLALDCGTTGLISSWNDTTNRWQCAIDQTGGGGVSDGDKGDIVVSAGGLNWAIGANKVTAAKVAADVAKTSDLTAKANLNGAVFTGPVTVPSLTLGATAVTTTGAELNHVAGVASPIQAQITARATSLNPVLTGTAALPTTITIGGLSLLPSLLELNHVDGVTGPIQTQIGNKQPLDTSELSPIAALTSAANKVPYYNGPGSAALADFTLVGRAVVGAATEADQRTAIGLGDLATKSTVTNADVAAGAGILGSKLAPASDVAAGVVTTGDQTFAGLKTFLGGIDVPASNTSGSTWTLYEDTDYNADGFTRWRLTLGNTNLLVNRDCQVNAQGRIPDDCLDDEADLAPLPPPPPECWYFYDADGLAAVTLDSIFRANVASTATQVWCETDTAGTTAVTLKHKGGSNIAGACSCTSAGVDCTPIANTSIADNGLLSVVIGTPAALTTRLTLCLEYSIP
jgi:hypothetical protein